MSPNETARRVHEGLCPGHVSTLAVTDPELIEVFDNVAFDEALVESRLPRTLNWLRVVDEITGVST